MSTYVVYADQDNTLSQGAPTVNYSTGTTLSIRSDGDDIRALVRFPTTLITGKTLVSAKFSFYCNATTAGDDAFNIYYVKRNWDDTTSCWSYYTGTTGWSTAGCENTTSDRSAVSMGSGTITATGWYNITLDLTEFGTMLSSGYGFIIIPSAGAGAQINSREGTYPLYLTVVTTEPDGNGPSYLSDYGVL